MADSHWTILAEHAAAAHALLLRLTMRQDVTEELLHDLFVRLSHSRRQLMAANNHGAYIRRAAINLAMDWRTKRARGQSLDVELVDQSSGPAASMERTQEVECVLRAAEHLTALERDALILHFVEQHSYEAVGRMLGKPAHQARGLCHAAVKRIRQFLASHREVIHD